MRGVGLVALALAVLRLHSVGAGEEAAPAPAEEVDSDLDLDEDFDLDDDDSGASPPGMQGSVPHQGEPVTDFDLGLPEEDRRKRMVVAFSYTLGRLQSRREMMEAAVEDMSKMHNMKREQAMNALLFTWMMSCYMNLQTDDIRQVANKPLGTPTPVSEEQEEALFAQTSQSGSQTVQTASQRQWKLLESVLGEHAKSQAQSGAGLDPRRAQQQQQQSQRQQPPPPVGTLDGQTGFFYVVVVFGIIFGIVLVAVLVLAKKGKKDTDDRDRGTRSAKKAEKNEKKLARKRMQ